MTLVGLTSLLVGGIGVANGVRAWLDARSRTIATLRCLGASSALVLTVCLIQVLALALCGIVIGLVGGAWRRSPAAWLKDVLPVPPVPGLYSGPLLLAAAYGLLTAVAFSLWPLGRAARIPGGALFRDTLLPERTRPSRPLLAANADRRGGPDRAHHRRRRRPRLCASGSAPPPCARWSCSVSAAAW